MFRAFSRPSSGAQWLQWQPLVFHRFVVTVVLCSWSGRRARPRTQHDYHHDTKVKPEAATAVIEVLMMGGKTSETFWTVNKRQDNKLINCCIWLVIYLNCTMTHGLTNLNSKNLFIRQLCVCISPIYNNSVTTENLWFFRWFFQRVWSAIIFISATTTQLLSSGEFYKVRYDTTPVKSASENFSFYINNSKNAKFWVVTLLSQMSRHKFVFIILSFVSCKRHFNHQSAASLPFPFVDNTYVIV
jgi:hypothetical protein